MLLKLISLKFQQFRIHYNINIRFPYHVSNNFKVSNNMCVGTCHSDYVETFRLSLSFGTNQILKLFSRCRRNGDHEDPLRVEGVLCSGANRRLLVAAAMGRIRKRHNLVSQLSLRYIFCQRQLWATCASK